MCRFAHILYQCCLFNHSKSFICQVCIYQFADRHITSQNATFSFVEIIFTDVKLYCLMSGAKEENHQHFYLICATKIKPLKAKNC